MSEILSAYNKAGIEFNIQAELETYYFLKDMCRQLFVSDLRFPRKGDKIAEIDLEQLFYERQTHKQINSNKHIFNPEIDDPNMIMAVCSVDNLLYSIHYNPNIKINPILIAYINHSKKLKADYEDILAFLTHVSLKNIQTVFDNYSSSKGQMASPVKVLRDFLALYRSGMMEEWVNIVDNYDIFINPKFFRVAGRFYSEIIGEKWFLEPFVENDTYFYKQFNLFRNDNQSLSQKYAEENLAQINDLKPFIKDKSAKFKERVLSSIINRDNIRHVEVSTVHNIFLLHYKKSSKIRKIFNEDFETFYFTISFTNTNNIRITSVNDASKYNINIILEAYNLCKNYPRDVTEKLAYDDIIYSINEINSQERKIDFMKIMVDELKFVRKMDNIPEFLRHLRKIDNSCLEQKPTLSRKSIQGVKKIFKYIHATQPDMETYFFYFLNYITSYLKSPSAFYGSDYSALSTRCDILIQILLEHVKKYSYETLLEAVRRLNYWTLVNDDGRVCYSYNLDFLDYYFNDGGFQYAQEFSREQFKTLHNEDALSEYHAYNGIY